MGIQVTISDTRNVTLNDLLKLVPKSKAAEEVTRLRTALNDIADPIGAMRRNLDDGCRLNGAMAVALASDPEYYKQIARAALGPNEVRSE